MSPLEQAQEAVDVADEALTRELSERPGNPAAIARAYRARAVAWRALADAQPLDGDLRVHKGLLLAAQHDRETAAEYLTFQRYLAP